MFLELKTLDDTVSNLSNDCSTLNLLFGVISKIDVLLDRLGKINLIICGKVIAYTNTKDSISPDYL